MHRTIENTTKKEGVPERSIGMRLAAESNNAENAKMLKITAHWRRWLKAES